jgi:hypothetical protein
MLDAAMDQYLGEIKDGRKKKTHQAYSVALRYFYQCIGNKTICGEDFKLAVGKQKRRAVARFVEGLYEVPKTFVGH